MSTEGLLLQSQDQGDIELSTFVNKANVAKLALWVWSRRPEKPLQVMCFNLKQKQHDKARCYTSITKNSINRNYTDCLRTEESFTKRSPPHEDDPAHISKTLA